MRFDKLTIKGQEAIQEAQGQCSARGHQNLEAAHLLFALLGQPEGSTLPILQKLGVPIEGLRGEVEKILKQIPKVTGGAAQPQISGSLSRIFQAAFQEAEGMKDEYVSTEHLLLAMAKDQTDAVGRILRGAGATAEGLLQALSTVRGQSRITDQDPESKYQEIGRASCRERV